MAEEIAKSVQADDKPIKISMVFKKSPLSLKRSGIAKTLFEDKPVIKKSNIIIGPRISNKIRDNVEETQANSACDVTERSLGNPGSSDAENTKTGINDSDTCIDNCDTTASEISEYSESEKSVDKTDLSYDIYEECPSPEKDSNAEDSATETLNEEETYELEPIFADYQLVGDSQLLRFAKHVLGIERKTDKKGKGWLGLCVSGQKICNLNQRVLTGIIPIGEKLILMIGTNDILKGTSSSDMNDELQCLLKTLFKVATKIVLLTLPPIPKLSYLHEHWVKLNEYNSFISSLKGIFTENDLEIVDVSSLFYQAPLKMCKLQYFELWFEGSIRFRRPDLIHLNNAGIDLIKDVLLKKLCSSDDEEEREG